MSVKTGDRCRNMKTIDENGKFHGCMKCDECTYVIKETLVRLVGKIRHLRHEKRVWEDRISQIRKLTDPGISGPLFYKGEQK